jgi:hypothetical protein
VFDWGVVINSDVNYTTNERVTVGTAWGGSDWGVVINSDVNYTTNDFSTGSVLRNVLIDRASSPVFSKPLTKSKFDGHLHRPQQTNLKINICQSSFKSFGKKWSIRPTVEPFVSNHFENHSFPTAILTSRYDDHNPFFQLSLLLNAWTLQIPYGTPTFVFGESEHQHIDEIWVEMFGAPLYYTLDLPRHIHVSKAYVPQIEFSGPIMQHLNDAQPCRSSKMIATFFIECKKAFGLGFGFESALDFRMNTRRMKIRLSICGQLIVFSEVFSNKLACAE